MAKLSEQDRERIKATLAQEHQDETRKQRMREAYEGILTQRQYDLMVENREAHFHPPKNQKAAKLLVPDELRKRAIESLEKEGIIHPDAPKAPPVESTDSPAPQAATATPAN